MSIEWMSARELRESYARRSLSPVEVARALIARIDRLNSRLHAFLSVDAEQVLAQARRAEAALFADEPLGPLHGVPVSVKDTLAVAGLPWTSGSALRDRRPAEQDAIAVARLRAAGALIVGKTNTPEFATSGRTVNRLGPETVNPWDVTRTAAGSSGGAGAAVAAGLGPIGVGTDAGGSIRYPAAFIGVFGLMPSYGRVPRLGNFEIDEFGSAFASIGPLARDVRDAALALQAMAGFDSRDPFASRRPTPDYLAACEAGVAGLTIGWLRPPAQVHREPGVEDAIREAFERFAAIGASLRELEAADLPSADRISGPLLLAGLDGLRRLAAAPEQRAQLTPYAAALLDAPPPSAEAEAEAWRLRRQAVERMAAMFAGVDLIASPVTCFTAPPCPQDPFAMFIDFDRYIPVPMLANVTGLAAASVPCGFHQGLPLGLMLMARRGDEATLLRAARAFETAFPWAEARPALAL